MNVRAIGDRVRAGRHQLRLTQCAAADRAGVSHRTWTDLENGHLNPTLATLAAVGGTIGVRVSELVAEGER